MNNKPLTTLSKQRLATCEAPIQRLVEEINKEIFVNVSCGHRGKEEQNKEVAEGKSKLKYPLSKHNSNPSSAVDIYPIVNGAIAWDRFDELGRIAKEKAKELRISIVWGGDWKMVDKPHIELIKQSI